MQSRPRQQWRATRLLGPWGWCNFVGEYFEQVVRERLADYSGNTPGKVRVMDMIKVPGTVIPHATERGSMVHLSVGEPLETFAKVEVRGKRPSPPSGTAERPGR